MCGKMITMKVRYCLTRLVEGNLSKLTSPNCSIISALVDVYSFIFGVCFTWEETHSFSISVFLSDLA